MSDAMHGNGCDRLDDFLDRDLSGDDRQRFVEHLDSCAACREAVAGHQALAQRLRIEMERIDSTPPMLASRIEGRILRDRFLRFAVTAFAASVAFAAMWLAIDRVPRRLSEPPPAVVQNRPTDKPTVQIRFPKRDVIAMPVASESPNVTVVMVYPELQARLPAPLERNER
jgi:anti-sigma factor RsiW